MAQMYPPDGPMETNSAAERRLYALFRERLGPEYSVIHSAAWHAVRRDGQVRDGEADFLVIHPLHGVLVLEIKGGRVTRNGLTRVWFSVNAEGERFAIKDPFAQARNSMYVLLDLLRTAPSIRPFVGGYRLGYGVWMPDIEWPREGRGLLQGFDVLALDARHLHQPDAALLHLYQHFAAVQLERSAPRTRAARPDPPHPLSDAAITAFIELVTPTIAAKSSLALTIAGEEARIRQLTAAQFERLRAMWRVQRQVAVPGGAGTGKTVLALEMAWRLAEEGLDVLLLCANQTLADWLADRVARDARPTASHLEVRSLKALVAAVAAQGGLRAQEISSLRITSPEHQKTLSSILSQNIRVLERRGPPRVSMPYDAVLVDEAQDIEQSLWTPIQKLLRDRTGGFFYVFYDEAQRVDLPGAWVFRPAGGRTYAPLTANCRNTGAIFALMAQYNPALASILFEGPPGQPIRAVTIAAAGGTGEDQDGQLDVDQPDAQWNAQVPSGARSSKNGHSAAPTSPVAPTAPSLSEALLQILDELLDERGGLSPEDVLVMTCRSAAKSRWRLAEHQQLGTHRLRWLRRGEKDGCVPLATIRAAKGLEYKVVVLVELDGLDEERRRDALLYVATSRAMYRLIMLGTELELGRVIPTSVSRERDHIVTPTSDT